MEQLRAGIVVVVDVGSPDGEGRYSKRIGEVTVDDERRGTEESILSTGRDETTECGDTGKTGAIRAVTNLQTAYRIGAVVLHNNLRVDGLSVFRFSGLGDCNNTEVGCTTGTTDAEIVDGGTIAKRGTFVAALRRGVDKAELQFLIEVTADQLGAAPVAVVGTAGGGTAEADIIGIVVPDARVEHGVTIVDKIGPVVLVVVVLDTQQAAASEVAQQTERQGVGTYLSDVDNRTV